MRPSLGQSERGYQEEPARLILVKGVESDGQRG